VVTFDDVLPTLVRICEESPGFEGVERAAVVRDLKGRVRLVVQFAPEVAASENLAVREHLATALSKAIPKWFEGPIVERATPRLARLAQHVLKTAEPWSPGWTDSLGGVHQVTSDKWRRIERHLSKLDWTSSEQLVAPWKLFRGQPAIVTFYSFKGGVGRTTLLAATAWQLARQGKRVVVVDLDVEAPGLASLLGAQVQRGVLDFLVDHAATGSGDLADLLAPARQLGEQASLVDVIGAGRLDKAYFEKLARLDFVGSLVDQEEARPVRESLRSLLKQLRARDPRPDYVLLDSRAGLHDVAGLSLHDLAHVDVVVARDSEQSLAGLEHVVEALGRRRASDELRCVLVQSMVPPDASSSSYKETVQRFRQRVYEMFQRSVYARQQEDDPDMNADDAAHYPQICLFQNRLLDFTALRDREAELFAPDFQRIVGRIEELCTPEGPPENE
jgi:MinD-like ATPase involved in chromosome partitioning or flagellar assembly